MKRARAYKRRDGWYFQAISKTTDGVGIGAPPRLKVDLAAALDALGKAVLQALHGSLQDVPHPTPKEADELFAPMLDLAEVKTWAAFAKHTSSASIENECEWLTIEPWKNEGAKIGFVPIPGVSVKIPAGSSPSEIGEALKKAIALCGPE